MKVVTTPRMRPGLPRNPIHLYPDLSAIEVIEADHLAPLGWITRWRNRGSPMTGGGVPREEGAGGWESALQTVKHRSRTAMNALGTGSLVSIPNLWIAPAVKAIRRLHTWWPFDVLVSTFGPAACHIIAAAARRHLSFYWVADYRDLWGGGDLLPVRWPFSSWQNAQERRTVQSADLLTTISEPFVRYLEDRFPGKEVLLVENGFDFEESEPAALRSKATPAKIQLVYTGTISLQHRDPEPLLLALQQLVEENPAAADRLEVVFYTSDGQAVKEMQQRPGLGRILRWGGYLSRPEILAVQRSADGLIFLDWDNPQVRGVLTGKLFEYLSSGAPLLSIGGHEGADASQLIVENGFGVAFGKDAEAIYRCLRDWINGHPVRYTPDHRLVERFSRGAQADRLLGEVKNRLTNAN